MGGRIKYRAIFPVGSCKNSRSLPRSLFFYILFYFLLFLIPDISAAETGGEQSSINIQLVGDLNPSELQRLKESRLDRGLTNYDTFSSLLMERARKSSGRKDLLDYARLYSPDLPATYFETASDRFNFSLRGIFESLDYMRAGIKAYERNFLWRFNLWGLIVRSFLISFILSVLIMFLFRFPSESGLIMHEIREDRRKTFLIFLPLVFSVFGLIPFLTSMTALYGLYFKKRDRIAIYISFVMLLFLSLSPVLFRIFPIPSYIKAVTSVNEGRDNRYGLSSLKGRKDLPSSFAYALALKREGYYQESIEVYRRLIERFRIPEVYINLGNALYASGDPSGAIDSYNRSISIRPLAAAYYNLSQVYREMLDFKRGEEYFEEAARLDSDSVRRYASLSGRSPNRFVVDVKLPDSYITEWIISERDGLIRVTFISIVTVLGITSFFIIDRGLRYRAKKCRRCGAVYCSRCTRSITWKDMCLRCYNSFIRMDQMYSKERVMNLLSLYQSRARRRMLARTLSFLLPGAGQIYSGRILEGFLLCWVFIFALTVIVLSRLMTGGIYPYHHDWLLPPSLFIIVIAYGISIFHIRRGIQKGWL